LRTLLFAPTPSRILLITLISIEYTRRSAGVLNPFEISVLSDVGHAFQHFRQAAFLGAAKRLRKNFSMLGFGASTIRSRSFAQALNQRFVYPANQ
jgi:hypothetical protein